MQVLVLLLLRPTQSAMAWKNALAFQSGLTPHMPSFSSTFLAAFFPLSPARRFNDGFRKTRLWYLFSKVH